MNRITLTCGAWPSPIGPGLIVSNAKRFSGSVPVPQRPKPVNAQVRAAPIRRMRVATLGVGLPDLDHGVGHRVARAIEHAPDDADALARRLVVDQHGADERAERVAVLLGREPVGEKRARPSATASASGASLRSPSASLGGRAGRCRRRSRARNPARSRRSRSGRSGARARLPARPGRSGRAPAADRPESTSA